jgi:hypothetical protein
VSFESVYGPVAKEVSFEYDQFLKNVGNGYRADLVAWPWKARYRPLALPAASLQAKVKAAAGWQSSGLKVEQGVSYEAAVDGTWRIAKAGQACSADGDAEGHGRLVAAVLVDDGRSFTLSPSIPLGGMRTFTAPADGLLVLRCADDWTQLDDNDGELQVTLKRATGK